MDTVLLRQHADEIRQKRRTAQQLADQLAALESLAEDSAQRARIRALAEDVRKLARYFKAMAEAVERISDDAEQVSLRIGRILQDQLDTNPAKTVFRQM